MRTLYYPTELSLDLGIFALRNSNQTCTFLRLRSYDIFIHRVAFNKLLLTREAHFRWLSNCFSPHEFRVLEKFHNLELMFFFVFTFLFFFLHFNQSFLLKLSFIIHGLGFSSLLKVEFIFGFFI